MYNFILGPCDTDSVSICKPDGSHITEQERENLLIELNKLMPEHIQWDDDGYFPSVLAVKAKNYVLKDEDGKVKIKGSALKVPMKEAALREFVNKIIDSFMNDKQNDIPTLYNNYVNEIYNLKDISRWVSKKNITSNVLNAERTNEQKVLDAIEDTDYVEGDRCFMYFTNDKALKLQEKWSNDHDPLVLLKKLYNTLVTFETVLDITKYPNYSLKKNLNEGRIIANLDPVDTKRKKKDAK